MNPCPCGYYGDPVKPCTCSPGTVTKYQKRISGPLLDRIDIHIEVPRVEYDKLSDAPPGRAVRVAIRRGWKPPASASERRNLSIFLLNSLF
jgi:magnesium chelatase family protein